LISVGAETARSDEYFELSPMTYVASEGKVNELVLTAQYARYSPTEEHVALTDVGAKMRAYSSAQGFELTSEKGSLNLETSVFVARGNVRGRLPDGRLLSTEVMQYDQEDGIVSSNTPVKILEGKMTYRGRTGFVYNIRKGRFRLLGGATLEQAR
jgi:LPS export ABC transporter protein LptC